MRRINQMFFRGIGLWCILALGGCRGEKSPGTGDVIEPTSGNFVFQASDGIAMEGVGLLSVTVGGENETVTLVVDSLYTQAVKALKFGIIATDEEWQRLMSGEEVTTAIGGLVDYRVDAPGQPIISRPILRLRAHWTASEQLSITGDLGPAETSGNGTVIMPDEFASSATFSVTWAVSTFCTVLGTDGIAQYDTRLESDECRAALERTGFGVCLSSSRCM